MWADRFGRRWNMNESNESMTNNNVKEDRSASTITRDVPPIMEVKHNRWQQLQSYTTHTTQLYIHTAIINQINDHMLASVPKLKQKSSIVHGAQDERCEHYIVGLDLSNSQMSLILDIFFQLVRTTLEAQWLHTVMHWVD